MKTGDLVTEKTASEGAPTWVGVVQGSGFGAGSVGLGWYVPVRKIGQADARPVDTGRLRPLTDDEALSVAAWLVAGDPGARWQECDDGACDLAHDDEPDVALWSCPEGDWAVYVPGQEDSIAHGRAPTDRSRRVAASRAFLAHLCGGAHD